MGAASPLPRSAIRPYPTKYVGTATLRNGEVVSVRPICPEDEPKVARFHRTLSAESVHLRYAGMMKLDARVAHDRLARICSIDYDREMGLVAERAGELIAVARLLRKPGSGEAEFALNVSDAFQDHGLGHELLMRLIQVGRDWCLTNIVAEILPENHRMQRICRELGFTLQTGEMVHAVKQQL